MWLGLQAILQRLRPEVVDQAERQLLELPQNLKLAINDPLTIQSVTVVPEQDVLPLPLPFDQIIQRMGDTGSIYSEGDGSFVLCGNERSTAENQHILWFGKDGQLASQASTPDWFSDAEQRSTWRIEGNLFDGAETTDHCTLVGFAPVEQWRYLIEILTGDDQEDLAFQFQQLGLFCTIDQILTDAIRE